MSLHSIPAVTLLLLGCVCAAQKLPELMGPAQPPARQTARQNSFSQGQPPSQRPSQAQPVVAKPPAGTPAKPPVSGGPQAAAAAGSAAAQAGTATPKALLPLRPPKVSYSNGMLGIIAENSTLADVLSAVRQKTGTSIDAPPSAASERVVISIGPAPANSVLTALLNGSRFDYIILGSQQATGAPQQLILREKQKEGTPGQPSPQGNTQAFAQHPQPVPAEAPQPDEEYIPEAEMPDEAQPEPQQEQQQPGAAAQQPTQQQNGQPQVKTPEQLLEELKLMQQQQQQQMQQQQQQPNHQPGAQQQTEPSAPPQNNDNDNQQQQMQPQQNMPPDGEAPPD